MRFNNTGLALNELLTIPGSTDPGVEVKFDDASLVRSFEAKAAQLTVLGQGISGDFAFTPGANGGMTLTAANVKVDLGPAHITGRRRHDPDDAPPG